MTTIIMLLEDIWGNLVRHLAIGSRVEARLDGFAKSAIA